MNSTDFSSAKFLLFSIMKTISWHDCKRVCMNVEQKRRGVKPELWPRAERLIPGVLICIQLEGQAIRISQRKQFWGPPTPVPPWSPLRVTPPLCYHPCSAPERAAELRWDQ